MRVKSSATYQLHWITIKKKKMRLSMVFSATEESKGRHRKQHKYQVFMVCRRGAQWSDLAGLRKLPL
jgi:hypothetical protein